MSVKIERIYAYRAVKNIFIYYKNIFCCPVVSAGVGSIYTNGNSSTMHQKGTGYVRTWFWKNNSKTTIHKKCIAVK